MRAYHISNKWAILLLLMLAYMLSFMDRYVINLLIEPMKHDLHLTDTSAGLLTGAGFAVFYALMSLPLGVMADRGSRVRIIASGIALWSFFTAICGSAKSFIQLLTGRIGVGVGEAALTPAAYPLLTDLFPKKQLATAIGIYSSGIYLGAGLAYIIGGYMLKLLGAQTIYTLPVIGSIFSWQLIFFILGLPGLLVALIFMLVKEPERPASIAHTSVRDFVAYMRSDGGTFMLISLGSAIFNIAVYATGVWIPSLLHRVHHMPMDTVGRYTGLGILILSPIGVVAGGRISDILPGTSKLKNRLLIIIFSLILFIPVCMALGLSDSVYIIPVLMAYALCVSIPVAVTAAAIQELVPSVYRSTASAFTLFLQNIIGLSLGPLCVALLTDHYYHDPLAIGHSLAIVCTVALVLSILIFSFTLSKINNQI